MKKNVNTIHQAPMTLLAIMAVLGLDYAQVPLWGICADVLMWKEEYMNVGFRKKSYAQQFFDRVKSMSILIFR